jgi:hypothetical protein
MKRDLPQKVALLFKLEIDQFFENKKDVKVLRTK